MDLSIRQGLFAGLFGTIGDIVIHSLAFFTLKTTTTAHYLSQLMFPGKDVNLVRYLLGVFAHLSAGTLTGVVFLLILKYFGKDHPYDKGIGFGIFLWIVHVIIIPNFINSPRPLIFRTESECIVDLIAHLIYGIIAITFLISSRRNLST